MVHFVFVKIYKVLIYKSIGNNVFFKCEKLNITYSEDNNKTIYKNVLYDEETGLYSNTMSSNEESSMSSITMSSNDDINEEYSDLSSIIMSSDETNF